MTAATAGAIYSMQGTGQLVGYIIWGLISDKFGRKVPAIGMALSAVAVFIYTQLGGNDVVAFYMVSALLGFMVGYSGPWGAYYTDCSQKNTVHFLPVCPLTEDESSLPLQFLPSQVLQAAQWV